MAGGGEGRNSGWGGEKWRWRKQVILCLVNHWEDPRLLLLRGELWPSSEQQNNTAARVRLPCQGRGQR